MVKVEAITLDSITYKDKWYAADSTIFVDYEDFKNLVSINAIKPIGEIPQPETKEIKPGFTDDGDDSIFEDIPEKVEIVTNSNKLMGAKNKRKRIRE